MMKFEDMEQQGRNSLDGGWTWSKLKTWKDLEDSLQACRTFVLTRIWFVIIYLFFFHNVGFVVIILYDYDWII